MSYPFVNSSTCIPGPLTAIARRHRGKSFSCTLTTCSDSALTCGGKLPQNITKTFASVVCTKQILKRVATRAEHGAVCSCVPDQVNGRAKTVVEKNVNHSVRQVEGGDGCGSQPAFRCLIYNQTSKGRSARYFDVIVFLTLCS